MKTKHSVLSSTDGPMNNVIKIKPPLCFSAADADTFVHALDDAITDVCP